MSYWSHHPELYDQILFEEMVEQGIVSEDCDDPQEVVCRFMNRPDSWKLAIQAERKYWESKII